MADHKILIVEDEAPIREMIAFNRTRAGFEVDEAGDSSSARHRIADSRPDLILIDWMLPDSTGLELTRSLRRDGDDTANHRCVNQKPAIFDRCRVILGDN